MKIDGYEVAFLTIVDRPERRDGAYTPVPAGTRILMRWWYQDRAAAIRVFQSILKGAEDYGSEYVARVAVYGLRAGGSATRVRVPVHRTLDRRDAAVVPGESV